ncbi:MAG TPA: excinuclease ABC subunit UvrB [Nitrospirales bacterium]|nr:excinuclease ABC subunit UvrB [Nitrospirales bacterium]HIB54029.1 excinuclease ABC subunit UvrB [Nitrospirales bacterium]HIN33895.1 excinuclease ABC subunit UvrB [Nitrospirales bacterium]
MSTKPYHIDQRLFTLVSDYTPKGDQSQAIAALSHGLTHGTRHQVLLGVTGSGKTFTMAGVIEHVQKPTLVMVHNKTLAAQLYAEFKAFFPHNAVEYFVSYYDYYQPEAYLPQTDTYIAKDANINDAIDRMRHAATSALLERSDVIIVSSVSCIYGLGSPEVYRGMLLLLAEGRTMSRETIMSKLVNIHYQRNDIDFSRGTFRVRGDVIDIYPAAFDDRSFRVELFDDTIETISAMDPLTGTILGRLPSLSIYPTTHYVVAPDRQEQALSGIEEELEERIRDFQNANLLVEAQRIEQRTRFDLEMIRSVGYCHGIENYSRHLSGRQPGEPPPTLFDYFPKDFLLIIDESHATTPQVRGMYAGDHSRKKSLVDFGFRLPSAYDNRPFTFEEFEQKIHQVVYVSATPGPYELERVKGKVVEQILRPTGLMDPLISIAPAKGQVDDLLGRVRDRVARNERVLVTTLTKRMAEDLCEYYHDLGLKVRYLHSDIDTLERIEIIRDLRSGEFDTLIGVNLLREGLDIPEVSLVAILDADKEGFLRSHGSLIQTIGRASRHVSGEAILYGDTITRSMKKTLDETNQRRKRQAAYNKKHGITPQSVVKGLLSVPYAAQGDAYTTTPIAAETAASYQTTEEMHKTITRLEGEMKAAAKALAFERAAALRDEIKKLKNQELEIAIPPTP